MPSFQLSFLGQEEPGCYQLHLQQKPRSLLGSLCHRPYREIHQVTSILFRNDTHRWFRITSSDKGSTSPIISFKNSSPESSWRIERQCSFPRKSTHTDLEWIVKIPNLDNVIMDACNAIDQPMPFKENTST
jgi:hypothetical protein